jgi:hypothetical protein
MGVWCGERVGERSNRGLAHDPPTPPYRTPKRRDAEELAGTVSTIGSLKPRGKSWRFAPCISTKESPIENATRPAQ